MADVINVEVYRYQHPNGGAKDWLILYTRDEVEVYYGKRGGTLRRSAIPRAVGATGRFGGDGSRLAHGAEAA